MKLFECPQLARLGTIITIGFSEKNFLFVCCETEDECGIPTQVIFITPTDLMNIMERCVFSRTGLKPYGRKVTFLKKIFHKFGFWSFKDEKTRKNFEEIMEMLRNNNSFIYELVKDCDLTTDVEIG